MTVIVSACLVGLKTRHDGGDALCEAVFAQGKTLVPFCPEQLGGLSTPRPAAWITEGGGADVIDGRSRVIDVDGRDVTPAFVTGAAEALKIARLCGAREAYLKEKSPSCGVSLISRDGSAVPGEGVTAALLRREGILVRGY